MYPVNIHGRTMAVFSLIKNLPVIQKSMEQGLELYDYFRENTPHNGTRYTFRSIVGSDIRFVEAISDAKCVARNQTTVLIYGETGTGKELFAQSIHNASPYQNGPFISVNCAAIPSTLLESMFFGTVKAPIQVPPTPPDSLNRPETALCSWMKSTAWTSPCRQSF